MIRRVAAALLAVLTVAACAHDDPRLTGFFAQLKNCRAHYAEIDAKIDAAGVRDASYYRIPGYPYLRTDRLLASFRNEVHGVDELGGWIRHMRESDQEAREFEYINLGLTTKEAAILRYDLLTCGRGLASIELDDPADLAHLMAVVVPPDDYSDSARASHLYPLLAPALRSRVAQEQAEMMRQFARPLNEAGPRGSLVLWRVKPVEDLDLVANGYGNAPPDELGFPGLFDSAWRSLAEINAPALWIETGGQHDQLGVPVWSKTGVTVDTEHQAVYYQVGFTRFGSERLAQITYFIWFNGRDKAPASSVDNNIDGLIWRVTLDPQARPLVYESLHMSGRDHLWFPTSAVTRKSDRDAAAEPALFPQPQIPDGPQALRLQSGTHALRRLVSPDQADAAETHSYELRRYEDLYTLPRPDGGTRSLFDKDGLIPGSQGDADFVLRASGIVEPGALRQLGHHAISYVERLEFDDPVLLESVFVPPVEVPPQT